MAVGSLIIGRGVPDCQSWPEGVPTQCGHAGQASTCAACSVSELRLAACQYQPESGQGRSGQACRSGLQALA